MKKAKTSVNRTYGLIAHGNAVRLMRQGRILITALSECQQNRYSLTFPGFTGVAAPRIFGIWTTLRAERFPSFAAKG